MLAAVITLSACSVPLSVDKAGGDVLVLSLATIDGGGAPYGQSVGPREFVQALEEISGGRLSVRLQTAYGEVAADAETRIVQGIAAGQIDGGWPATRAFEAAGLPGLSVVEAPFVITSYAAQKAVVTGPVSGRLLDTLDGSGLVALGLTVGPLRRPWSVRAPLLDPTSWQGEAFRVFNSAVQDATVQALGGTPVAASYDFPALVDDGTLQGVELDLAQYVAAGYANLLPYATSNVVLWPKMFVLSLSQRVWDSLGAQQQEWIRQAAQRAVDASVAAEYPETEFVAAICAQGVRFAAASAEQLAALGQAVDPVLSDLASDPTTAQLLQQIRAVVSDHPGTDVLDIPQDCLVST